MCVCKYDLVESFNVLWGEKVCPCVFVYVVTQAVEHYLRQVW